MTAPPDIAALIAEADAALEFYQPSNIDYMGLVKELRDALEACARDAATYRAALDWIVRDAVYKPPEEHNWLSTRYVECAHAAIDRARGEG